VKLGLTEVLQTYSWSKCVCVCDWLRFCIYRAVYRLYLCYS